MQGACTVLCFCSQHSAFSPNTLLLLPTFCCCSQLLRSAKWTFLAFLYLLSRICTSCTSTRLFLVLYGFLCFVVSWRALFNSQPFSKGQITREYLYLKHFPQETAGIQTDKSTKTPPESEAAVAPSPLEGPALLCPAHNSVSLPDQAAGAGSPRVGGIPPSSPAPSWTHPRWMSADYRSIRNSSSDTESGLTSCYGRSSTI